MRPSHIISKEIRDLSSRGLDIIENPSIAAADKSARVAPLDARLKSLTAELKSSEYVEAQTKNLGGLGGQSGLWSSAGNAPTYGAPSLNIGDSELKALFDSARSQQHLKVELKNNADIGASMPPQLIGGIVTHLTEPTRIADQLPSGMMQSPVIEYIRHVATSGAALPTAVGQLKPEVDFLTDTILLHATKIAAVSGVTDESLEDFPAFASYITAALTKAYIDAENSQLLNGDGTGSNMTGLLNTSGIIVRPVGSNTVLDAMELAGVDMRNGSTFSTPTMYICHPTDFSLMRRAKDSQGRYLVNPDPTVTEASALWGRPVIQTTQIPVGTAIAIDAPAAAQVWYRRGITIDSTNSHIDNFQRNVTHFRIEARLGLAVIRPGAVVKITGIA